MTEGPTCIVLILHERLVGGVKADVGDDGVAVEDHCQAIQGGSKYGGRTGTESPQRKRLALWAIEDFNEVVRTAIEVFQPVKGQCHSDSNHWGFSPNKHGSDWLRKHSGKAIQHLYLFTQIGGNEDPSIGSLHLPDSKSFPFYCFQSVVFSEYVLQIQET